MSNSSKLPKSSSMKRRLSDGTLDSYNGFRNYLLCTKDSFGISDDDQAFPTNDKQEARRIKGSKLFMSDVQGVKKSNVVGLNKKIKKEMVVSNSNEGCLPTNISTKGKPAVAQLFPKAMNDYDSDDRLNKINFITDECASTSNSSITYESEYIESEEGSETETISRYGRIRKATQKYINAAMFGNNTDTSSEIKLKAATLINSNKCRSRSFIHIEDTSEFYSDEVNCVSPTYERADSPELKTPANEIINGSSLNNSRRSRSRSSNTSGQSSFISNSGEQQSLNQIIDLVTPTSSKGIFKKFAKTSGNEIVNSSNNQGEIIFEKSLDKIQSKKTTCSSQNGETFPKSKVTILQNLVLCPANKQEKSVEHVTPSIYNLDSTTLSDITSQSSISHTTCQTSNDDFEDVVDDLGMRPDPNEIHAVVNNEVVSFEWHTTTPDLDLIFSNKNVHYSMLDLKSFYTTVKVGYLKIDAGHRELMEVLKDCIMLYFVERGEAMFRVAEREIVGQIGSTFFIPLGIECIITNLKTEDLILKFVKMFPTAEVL